MPRKRSVPVVADKEVVIDRRWSMITRGPISKYYLRYYYLRWMIYNERSIGQSILRDKLADLFMPTGSLLPTRSIQPGYLGGRSLRSWILFILPAMSLLPGVRISHHNSYL
jgi:hypothetical protein|nr:hypothetical protein Q903MT_gene3118 [Picea sitchensis]